MAGRPASIGFGTVVEVPDNGIPANGGYDARSEWDRRARELGLPIIAEEEEEAFYARPAGVSEDLNRVEE